MLKDIALVEQEKHIWDLPTSSYTWCGNTGHTHKDGIAIFKRRNEASDLESLFGFSPVWNISVQPVLHGTSTNISGINGLHGSPVIHC